MARGWKPGRIRLGPAAGVPFTGMNTSRAITLLGPGEAATCNDVDLTDGTLRGLYGPGTAVTTLSASSLHLRYEDAASSNWKDGTSKRFALTDTISAGTGYRFSFYADPTPGVLRYSNGDVTNIWAGIGAPSTAPTEDAASGTTSYRSYRYTYYTNRTGDTYQEIESNPSSSVRTTKAKINVTASSDTGVDGIRVYATNGDTSGPYYLTDTFANTTASVTPSATSTSATLLDWELSGVGTNATYIYDHAPAPSPNIISNSLHVANLPGSILPCSGILFVAVGSSGILQWSETGHPWYFPYANGFRCDGKIEAIVTDQATTYVFTAASIYVITGVDDEELNFQRVTATLPITQNAGLSAVPTPHGVVYQCDSGLALFDGHASRLITSGVLSTTDFYGKTYACAWRDDQLIMLSQSDSNGGYVVDFSTFPALKVTKHDVGARALTQATAYATAPGTYVEIYSSGAVKRWHPRWRDGVSGAAAQAWTWTSGALDAGSPIAAKRFVRIWVESSGTISIAAKCYTNAATQVGSTCTLTGSQWLPANFIGDYLQLTITSSDGTGVVYGLTVDVEVMG